MRNQERRITLMRKKYGETTEDEIQFSRALEKT